MDNFFFVKNLPRVRDVYTSGALEVFKKFLRVKKMSRVCVACVRGRVLRVHVACAGACEENFRKNCVCIYYPLAYVRKST